MEMEKKHYKKEKLDNIDKTCLECSVYNEIYNENYSYGDYVMLKKLGKLKPVPKIDIIIAHFPRIDAIIANS